MSHAFIDDCLKNVDDCTVNYSCESKTITKILLAFRSQFISKSSSEDDFVYCSLPYVHSAIEDVGVDKLFKHKDIVSLLPLSTSECSIRTSFSYGPTIGRKLFNYNTVLTDLTNRDLRKLKCDCSSKYADFVYQPHGHVHTGHLGIIQCEPLRWVMSKGAKFRLKTRISRSKIVTLIEESLSKLAVKLSARFDIRLGEFSLWFEALMKIVKDRVKALPASKLESNDVFKQPDVKKYIEHLHDRFVIVPVDKASNNFAIICKKFYLEVLMKELGIANGVISGNDVYKLVKITETRFFMEHAENNIKYKHKLEPENQHIPLLYWTSKQHKNPFKFRFISGASHSYNKSISKDVSAALKHIKNHFKNFCAKIKHRQGFSCFWSIDNSNEFILKLSTIDRADSIKTYDFSTLYTNLPLDYIYQMLEKLISKMFASSRSDKMWINGERGKAFWAQGMTDYKKSGYKCYDQDDLLKSLHYILFETYVKFAGNIFKQTKGIPMGGNASPFIADLCLAWAEYTFMMDLSESKEPADIKLCKQLSNNSRYIDDISVLNYLSFGELSKRIYHEELLLEESTFGYHYDHFLDLNIRIFDNKFIVGIYHKVDDFDFEVISFPFPESNIHSKVGYNCFYSQLIRFYRLCNNVLDFAVRVKMLFKKLSGRGYSGNILKRFFLKFCGRFPVDLKYDVLDGNALWEKIFVPKHNFSCSIYDYEAIGNIIRPCRVVLNDTCPTFVKNLKIDDLPINMNTNISQSCENVNFDNSTVPSFIPPPLDNPSNHCYVNSTLQIFLRILFHFDDSFHTNDNREGCLIKCLMDDFHSSPSSCLLEFKNRLARLNVFFNGCVQRDVLEAFSYLMDLIHFGTRINLLGDNTPSGLSDDQFVYSLTKRLFLFTLKQSTTCLTCRSNVISYSESKTHFLYPRPNCSVKDLLEFCVNSNFYKICSCCDSNQNHEVHTRIEHPPEILVLVINRFSSSVIGDKNRDGVLVNDILRIANTRFELLGSIHHHGSTIQSGHYTCNVFYPESAYTCNDRQIISITNPESSSDSVYLLFYCKS